MKLHITTSHPLKTALTVAALSLGGMTHSAFAETWIAMSNMDCQAHNPAPQPHETATWSGECQDGYIHGEGTLQWYEKGKPTGSATGLHLKGKLNGYAVVTWANGDRYEGEYKDDYMHGNGKFVGAEGDTYTGEYKDGYWHGKGVATWANGDRYEGDWYKSELTGIGIYTYADGDKYEGRWLNGDWHGKGVLIAKDGIRYSGEFRNSYKHGLGRLTIPKGHENIAYWEAYEEGGYWQGNLYIIEGQFAHNSLVLACTPTPKACEQARQTKPRRHPASKAPPKIQ